MIICSPSNDTNFNDLSDFEGHFSCLKAKTSTSHTLKNIALIRHEISMYRPTKVRKRTMYRWPIILTEVSKLKDFSRSHAVTYIVKVVMSEMVNNRNIVNTEH